MYGAHDGWPVSPLPDTPAFREMWGDVRPGVPRGGLEPAIKAGIKARVQARISTGFLGQRITPHAKCYET